MNIPSMKEKVAIITGAGRGQGAATAKLFAEAGAKVVVSDIDEKTGESVVKEINASGGTAFFQRADVAKVTDVEQLVAAAVQRYGKLDAAVNNAACMPDTRPITELVESEFDHVISVDLKSVAFCLKYEILQMLRQGGAGAIVNIASTSSFRPQVNNPAYVAAKHGVIGLTKAAAMENSPKGIRINSVSPGAIDTPMLHDALADRGGDIDGDIVADFTPHLSLFNRFGKSIEVAQASLWLCSDLSSYVTGANLAVDAGYINR